jgi:hypothetical protein
MIGGTFAFLEELLPGTDFIPSFTLMWFLQRPGQRDRHSYSQKKLLKGS